MRALIILGTLSILSIAANAQNLIVSTSNVATFHASDGDDSVYYIYEDSKNADLMATPGLLRYYPEPLLIPEKNLQKLVFSEDEISRTPYSAGIGKVGTTVVTEVSIKMFLRTQQSGTDAAAAVKAATGLEITAGQIGVLPLSDIQISIPDLDRKGATCQLKTPKVPVTGGEPYIKIQFECTDKLLSKTSPKTNVDFLKQHLKSMPTVVRINYKAKEAERSSATISTSQITSAAFYAKLRGLGDIVNVSRDDMRKLDEEAKQEVKITSVGLEMTQDQRSICFSPLMTAFPNIEIDRKQVNDEVLKHTFNGDDLNPTRVDKELSDTLDKGSTESHLIVSGKASGSLADLLKADTSGSVDTLNKWATEHGVKVEWDGQRWVAKGLDVLQVNTTQLVTKISHACVFQTYAASTPKAFTEKTVKWDDESEGKINDRIKM